MPARVKRDFPGLANACNCHGIFDRPGPAFSSGKLEETVYRAVPGFCGALGEKYLRGLYSQIIFKNNFDAFSAAKRTKSRFH